MKAGRCGARAPEGPPTGDALADGEVAVPGCPVQRVAAPPQLPPPGRARRRHDVDRHAALLHQEPAHRQVTPPGGPQQRVGAVPVFLQRVPAAGGEPPQRRQVAVPRRRKRLRQHRLALARSRDRSLPLRRATCMHTAVRPRLQAMRKDNHVPAAGASVQEECLERE